MPDEFRNLLPVLRPCIPPALLDGDGWDRFLERVGDLPARPAANIAGLELRLGEPDPAADCAVSVGPDDPLRSYYVRRGETAPSGSAPALLGDFLARSAGGNDADFDAALFDAALLEYDIAQITPGVRPEPGIFLKLVHGRDEPATPAALTAELSAAVGWNSPAVADAVARVFDALPPGGRVAWMGAMPDRPPAAVKLVTRGVAAGEVAAFLERAGWAGSTGKALEVLADVSPFADEFSLYLDVAAEGPLPRLGLGLYAPQEGQGADSWRPLLELLVELGWCRTEKKAGLLAFIGIERLFHPQYGGTLYKGINHVKLTIEDGRVQAKAYAWFRLI